MAEQTKRKISPMTLLIWIGVGILLVFFALGLRNAQKPQPIAGNPAPEIEFVFFDGYEWNGQGQANLSDMRGNVVVLNFWAGWCVPCQAEAAVLEKIAAEYADQGVIFVGLAWSDTDKNALDFLVEYDVSYPNAPDLKLRGGDAYRITGVPETFIIDKEGIVRHFRPSALTEPVLRSLLEDVLES